MEYNSNEGLYDPTVDINKDTPEKIYKEILEAAKQKSQQYQQNQQGQQTTRPAGR